MSELILDGKFIEDSSKRAGSIALPFPITEAVIESAAQIGSAPLDLFTQATQRLIWGGKKGL